MTVPCDGCGRDTENLEYVNEFPYCENCTSVKNEQNGWIQTRNIKKNIENRSFREMADRYGETRTAVQFPSNPRIIRKI